MNITFTGVIYWVHKFSCLFFGIPKQKESSFNDSINEISNLSLERYPIASTRK